jgi:5,10-methylenetetrahydromethanopterin reductase
VTDGARPEAGLGLRSDLPFGDFAGIGRRAEELGFDVVSVFADLGFPPPVGALLQLAQATSRVRIGPACLNPSLLHPVEIAGQTALLDEASAGRAFLGLARGSWLEAVGADPVDIRAVEECAEIVSLLLAGDTGGYRGERFHLDAGFRLHHRRVRPQVPLMVGTWGRVTARRSARWADEVKIGGCANPAMVRRMGEWLVGAGGAGDRRPRVVVGAVTVVDRDRSVARALARREAALYVDVVATLDQTLQLEGEWLGQLRAALAAGDPVAAGARIPSDLLDRFTLCGTPDDVAGQAAELYRAGAGRVEFGPPHGTDSRSGIDLLGQAVLPQLTALPT